MCVRALQTLAHTHTHTCVIKSSVQSLPDNLRVDTPLAGRRCEPSTHRGMWEKGALHEVHLQVRKYMKTIIKPGLPLTDMCETLESTVRKLIDERGLDAGEKGSLVGALRMGSLVVDAGRIQTRLLVGSGIPLGLLATVHVSLSRLPHRRLATGQATLPLVRNERLVVTASSSIPLQATFFPCVPMSLTGPDPRLRPQATMEPLSNWASD